MGYQQLARSQVAVIGVQLGWSPTGPISGTRPGSAGDSRGRAGRSLSRTTRIVRIRGNWPVGSSSQSGTPSDEMSGLRETLKRAPITRGQLRLSMEWPPPVSTLHAGTPDPGDLGRLKEGAVGVPRG